MKKPNQLWINLKKTWPYLKKSKSNLIFYALVAIIEGALYAVLPLVGAKVILNITSALLNQLFLSALLVFLIDLVLGVLSYLKGLYWQQIYRKTLIDFQISIARETLKIEIKEIDKETSGLFIDRLNKDTADIARIFMEYTYWFSYIIANAGVLLAVFILNRYLFGYAILTATVLFLLSKKRLSKQYAIQKELSKIQEKKTGLTSELVRGIRDIKVLNADETILKKTSDKINEASDEEMKMILVTRKYLLIENSVRTFTEFVFILLGIYLYTESLITIPTFIILYNYQWKIQNLMSGVVQILESNKKFVIASDRVFEILDSNKFTKEIFGSKKLNKIKGEIEFKNVSFSYNASKEILKDMSFTINPNQTVAFVGKSGAGKTTIFNLISKMYQRNSGEILIDGISIDDLEQDAIRDNISIITQNPYIFNFSIKDNLLLSKENATMKEIRNACKLAAIDDFIMSLPNKYDTLVGENGITLSGGERQRIAIARALLKKTEIILFDEATSSLDNETQSKIHSAISSMKGEFTIIIIAHRLSTIIESDKIFLVDDGKVIDSGNHKTLLKNNDFYRSLYEKDFLVDM